jgi:transposase
MEQNSVNPVQRFVGLDLGDSSSSYCVLDALGKRLEEAAVPTTRPELERVFAGQPRSRIVMEATRCSHWVRQTLQSFGHEVIVANPRQLDLITKSLRKTDRNDARMLARIGRSELELVSAVHERSDVSMRARTLMHARTHLVRTRTRLINLVRSSFKVFGYQVPTCSPDAFHVRARSAMPAELEPALLPLLGMLEKLKQTVQHYNREIARISDQFPQTKIFEQIYGVGPLLALAFVTSLEDPARFPDSRSVGAFLGLTPGSRQSGASNPHLGITKQGDGELRTLLATAGMHIMRRSAPDCDLKRYGKRIASGGTPRDRGRARIAVARKLAVLMHRLWLTGEVYQPLRSSGAATA